MKRLQFLAFGVILLACDACKLAASECSGKGFNPGNVPFYASMAGDRTGVEIYTNQAKSAGILDPDGLSCLDMELAKFMMGGRPDPYYFSFKLEEILVTLSRSLGVFYKNSQTEVTHILHQQDVDRSINFLREFNSQKRQIPRSDHNENILVGGIGPLGREITWLVDRLHTNSSIKTPTTIIGIDHSSEIVSMNIERFRNHRNVQILEDDLLHLDRIPSDSISVAYIMFSTIFEFAHGENINEKMALLKSVKRVLKSPGALVIDFASNLSRDGRSYSINPTNDLQSNLAKVLSISLSPESPPLHVQPIHLYELARFALQVGLKVYFEPVSYTTETDKERIIFILTKI